MLASCDANKYEENEWFSVEKLRICDALELPKIEYCDYLKVNDEDVYVNINPFYYDYLKYVNKIYDYLKFQNYEYLGTRGERINTLAGSLTSYYFKETYYLEDFICNEDGHNWIFVYSDGTKDENENIIFNIILIDLDQSSIQYKGRKQDYTMVIRLRHKSESPLNGYYELKQNDDKNE